MHVSLYFYRDMGYKTNITSILEYWIMLSVTVTSTIPSRLFSYAVYENLVFFLTLRIICDINACERIIFAMRKMNI